MDRFHCVTGWPSDANTLTLHASRFTLHAYVVNSHPPAIAKGTLSCEVGLRQPSLFSCRFTIRVIPVFFMAAVLLGMRAFCAFTYPGRTTHVYMYGDVTCTTLCAALWDTAANRLVRIVDCELLRGSAAELHFCCQIGIHQCGAPVQRGTNLLRRDSQSTAQIRSRQVGAIHFRFAKNRTRQKSSA
jgi:hypothetical protein